jgi:Complex I intermediate-associated protein 30 (CIA30)
MVSWRNIFPAEGGGAIRRWSRAKMQLIGKRITAGDSLFRAPIDLFNFQNHDDAADARCLSAGRHGEWRISDDEVIGGYSRSDLFLISNMKDQERVIRGEAPDTFTSTSTNLDMQDSDFIPYIRWKGVLDTRIGPTSNVSRSGFCAIKSPEFLFGIDLRGKYNALELQMRADGRRYIVNLHVLTMFPGDLYQIAVSSPSNKDQNIPLHEVPFTRVLLPFIHFRHTLHGRIRDVERKLDYGANLDSIGVTLMDGVDGSFEMDVKSIRAVNCFHGDVIGEDDEVT